jgi:uncharacterized protein
MIPGLGERQHWAQTFTGRAFWLDDPRPEDISPRDLAHHLACINRFVGATRKPYSVAQHCVLVAMVLAEEARGYVTGRNGMGPALTDEQRRLALAGLLHDASEAYIGDITSPMKRRLGGAVKPVEDPIQVAVAQRFGIAWPFPREVTTADLRMLMTEKRDLMAEEPMPWNVPYEPYVHIVINPWSWQEAKERYIWALEDLTGEAVR